MVLVCCGVIHAQYIYALVKEHLLANALPVEEMTTDEQFHQVICFFDYELILECGISKPRSQAHLKKRRKGPGIHCLCMRLISFIDAFFEFECHRFA